MSIRITQRLLRMSPIQVRRQPFGGPYALYFRIPWYPWYRIYAIEPYKVGKYHRRVDFRRVWSPREQTFNWARAELGRGRVDQFALDGLPNKRVVRELRAQAASFEEEKA